MAEGNGLLNRRGGLNLYRGFKSLPLRHVALHGSAAGKLVAVLLLGAVVMAGTAGCRSQSAPQSSPEPSVTSAPGLPSGHPQTSMPADIPKIEGGGVVVVPESVKGKWGAVRLVVEDKSSGTATEYAVPLRSRFEVPNSSLVFEVGDFLPDFTIQDSVFTSVTDRPDNPAVKLKVLDGGNAVFDAWLFAMYPSVHPFTHPRYGLALKEGIPAT